MQVLFRVEILHLNYMHGYPYQVPLMQHKFRCVYQFIDRWVNLT